VKLFIISTLADFSFTIGMQKRDTSSSKKKHLGLQPLPWILKRAKHSSNGKKECNQ
jgi:hypothetical protein